MHAYCMNIYLVIVDNYNEVKQVIRMPSLQVRHLPEHIYRKIVELARIERRSISQETIKKVGISVLGFE